MTVDRMWSVNLLTDEGVLWRSISGITLEKRNALKNDNRRFSKTPHGIRVIVSESIRYTSFSINGFVILFVAYRIVKLNKQYV